MPPVAPSYVLADIGREEFNACASRYDWRGERPVWPFFDTRQVHTAFGVSIYMEAGGKAASVHVEDGVTFEETIRRFARERVCRLIREDVSGPVD